MVRLGCLDGHTPGEYDADVNESRDRGSHPRARTEAGSRKTQPGAAPGSEDRPAGRPSERSARTAAKAGHGHAAGGHFRHSYSKDRAKLIRRLSRIEGQVRGIARMIEREEYCVDILQQTAALRAAVDGVALLILEDHVQGCVRTAAEQGEAEVYADEVLDVVRRTLGRPVRSGRPT